MGTLSPIETALIIVLAVAAGGIVISAFRKSRNFSGYETLAGDVDQIAKRLGGEVFRDGDDLVISGQCEKAPTIVRFSNAESTPGLVISMQAPATFALSISPVTGTKRDTGNVIRTPDARFDAKFVTRSKQPMQASMLLTANAMESVRRLCITGRTFLAVTPGEMEFRDLAIPAPRSGPAILAQLEAMRKLSQVMQQMPGAEKVRYRRVERERYVMGRLAIAAGLVVAIVVIIAAHQPPEAIAPSGPPLPMGLLPAHAQLMAQPEGWRIAQGGDFDGNAVGWLRDNGTEPSGKITGDFSGHGGNTDTAYILLRGDGTRRVVIIAGNENRYDVQFNDIAIAARIPRAAISRIKWQGGDGPGEVNADGLLLVRDRKDPASGVVLFVNGKKVVSAAPENFTVINLQ